MQSGTLPFQNWIGAFFNHLVMMESFLDIPLEVLGALPSRKLARVSATIGKMLKKVKNPNLFYGCPKILKLCEEGVHINLGVPAKNLAKIRSLGPKMGLC